MTLILKLTRLIDLSKVLEFSINPNALSMFGVHKYDHACRRIFGGRKNAE